MSDYYFLNECKELKELISENPDLPLMFFADDTGNDGDYSYMSCSMIRAHKGKILDCPSEVDNEIVFDDKRYFEEELVEMLCEKYAQSNLSDEEFKKIFEEEKSKYDDKWKDCIVVYVGNWGKRMKVEIIAHLDFEKDTLEIEDGMTNDEIDNYLFDYILDFLDWNWKEVEEWNLEKSQ